VTTESASPSIAVENVHWTETPKSTKPQRIAENFDVSDFELTGEQLAAIDGLDAGTRGRPGAGRHHPGQLRHADPRGLTDDPDLRSHPDHQPPRYRDARSSSSRRGGRRWSSRLHVVTAGRRPTDGELPDPQPWGTTFTLVQTVGRTTADQK
jgi:hypothetical protein